jgi:hypothetical protein
LTACSRKSARASLPKISIVNFRSNKEVIMADEKLVQEASWLSARLQEKTTYAGLVMLLSLAGVAHATQWETNIETIGIGLGMLLAGITAILTSESKGKTIIKSLVLCFAVAWLFGPLPADAQTAAPAATPAPAASPLVNLPTVGKAQASANPFISQKASGFYLGVGTSVGVASSSVSGNVFALPGITGGSTTAAGGTIDADVGYVWNVCLLQTWCQIEADVKYTNIDGSSAVGTISSRWVLTQEFDVGADMVQAVLKYFPTFTNPFPSFNPTSLLPSAATVSNTPLGYVGFKQAELLINGNVGQAGGQTWAYAPGVTSGFRWQTLGANGKPNGGSLKVFADILWPTKGVSIANLFGAGGAPVVTQANANLNTMFIAGLHYDFGI